MKPHHHVAAILLLGLAFFAATRVTQPTAASPVEDLHHRIDVTEGLMGVLEARFEQRFGAPPGPAEQQALVEQYVDEEILVRQARSLAMGIRDASVRLRLMQKMRAVGSNPRLGEDELIRQAMALGLDDDLVIRRLLAEEMRLELRHDLRHGPGSAPPSDAEIENWLKSHGQRFEKPARLSLRHCFRQVPGDDEEVAAELRTKLGELPEWQLSRARAPVDCDGFPLGSHLRAQSRDKLTGLFGEAFADRVFELDPGRWSGPIASSSGLHLIFVEERFAARLPDLQAVRSQVTQDLLDHRGDQRLAERMAALRTRYEVREMWR